jgi:NADH:ubiquinone reductase (H+-translocating)
MFHEKLSAKAADALRDMGVECWFDCHVTAVTPDRIEVTMDATKELRVVDTQTVLWAAGVKASPLGKMLAEQIPGTECDRGGRVTVAADCTLPGRPDVFLIGDMAAFKQADGKPLPGLAPVAMQQGSFVANTITGRLRGEAVPAAFRYWDKGSMATIGRAKAVAETHGLKLSGFIAWLAWLFIHILYLARFENRFLVLFQWTFNYVTRNRAARLITGVPGEHLAVKPGVK